MRSSVCTIIVLEICYSQIRQNLYAILIHKPMILLVLFCVWSDRKANTLSSCLSGRVLFNCPKCLIIPCPVSIRIHVPCPIPISIPLQIPIQIHLAHIIWHHVSSGLSVWPILTGTWEHSAHRGVACPSPQSPPLLPRTIDRTCRWWRRRRRQFWCHFERHFVSHVRCRTIVYSRYYSMVYGIWYMGLV